MQGSKVVARSGRILSEDEKLDFANKHPYLYHGTPTKFNRPLLALCRDSKDFGKGFYLTTDYRQADEFARSHILHGSSEAYVQFYRLLPQAFSGLKVLSFDSLSVDWLDFIVSNRMDNKPTLNGVWDVVYGGVVDARQPRIILAEYRTARSAIRAHSPYIPGRNSVLDRAVRENKEIAYVAMEMLEAERLANQLCFLTERAIGILGSPEKSRQVKL